MARTQSKLKKYHEKRDFKATPEPKGRIKKRAGRSFVIQKHDATRLHYDFRLELDGVLKSWAVTKGPSLDPSVKRLAVRTEDHPVDYGDFEGVIPSGYGAGTVILWDRGEWEPQDDPHEGLDKGALKFTLRGERIKGGFALIRMKPRPGEKKGRENWLLIKERDENTNEKLDPTKKWETSVESGKTVKEMSASEDIWTRESRGKRKPPKDAPARKGKRKKKKAKEARKAGGRVTLKFVKPQLATLREEPPKGEGWLHEIKYDGYRIIALVQDGAVKLITRNEQDWTHRYEPVAGALAELDVKDAIFDGEVAALGKDGRTSFHALQEAEKTGGADLAYFVFDLLRLDGKDLRRKPMIERKEALKALLQGAPAEIRYSDHVKGSGEAVFGNACSMRLEGIVSKKAAAAYVSGRGTGWVKTKCINTDEFIIGGYRKSGVRDRPFSSLLLGEYVGDALEYRGRVGTGFDGETLQELKRKMAPLERKKPPFASTPADARRGAVWLKPELIGQVAYTERTSDGALRHPIFLGLREDKEPEEVEMPKADKEKTNEVAGVRLTHPGRVLYPEQGATKLDLAHYYAAMADRILPHLAGRPLSLVRCPSGQGGDCFFQKHRTDSSPDEIREVMVKEKNGKTSPYLRIDDVAGLVASAQIGALELHVWGARADRIERPERVVFDLDPDEEMPFERVRDAAAEVRDVLRAAGLASFPLITGGKGVHVIAPIERRSDWSEVKEFARGLANALEAAAPDRYVAGAAKARRKGRIFVDWLRNERGATAVAPYSPRARKGAPVATPVSWAELSRLDSPAKYTLSNIGKRMASLKTDPWKGYGGLRQSITRASMDALAKQAGT